MRRILVLRPEPGASATLSRARERGLDALAIPLFEIVPVDWKTPEPARFDGLLLTSANAIRHGGAQLELLRSLPVYAVGEATAEAARQAGFEIAATGDVGVDRLLSSIDTDLRLMHLCGADRRAPADGRREISPMVVYRSVEIEKPDLSPATDKVALVHSPRAGERFAELVSSRGSIAIVAISDAAANAVGEGWKSISVAERPSDEALLALAASLCNNSQPK